MNSRPNFWEERKGRVRVYRNQDFAHSQRSGGADSSRSTEVVVKVISWGKSARSAAALVRYVCERSEHLSEAITVETQDGTTLSAAEASLHLVTEWGLVSDNENLSRQAEKLSRDERDLLPESERLRHRQVGHLVLSFPHSTSNLSDGQITAIAHDTLAPYADDGYRYMLALHRESAHPHVHVILSVRNDQHQAITISKSDIQEMRVRIAASANVRADLNLTATPFKDRFERPEMKLEEYQARAETGALTQKDITFLTTQASKLFADAQKARVASKRTRLETQANKIHRILLTNEDANHNHEKITSSILRWMKARLKGHSILEEREGATRQAMPEVKKGAEFRVIPKSLERKAPLFVARHGYDIALDRTGAEPRVAIKPPPRVHLHLPELPVDQSAAIRSFFQKAFTDPDRALSRYLELAAEQPRTATWYLEKQPGFLGQVRQQHDAHHKAELRQIKTIQFSTEWRTEALTAIQTAIQQDPSREARQATIQELRKRYETPIQAPPVQEPSIRVEPIQQPQPHTSQPVGLDKTESHATKPVEARQTPIMRMAPMWYARHGVQWEARRSGQPQPEITPPALRLPSIPPVFEQKTRDFFQAHYLDAEAARTRFIEMLGENDRGAFYHLKRHPQVFGDLKPDQEWPRVSQRDFNLGGFQKAQVKSTLEIEHRPNAEAAAIASQLRALKTIEGMRPYQSESHTHTWSR